MARSLAAGDYRLVLAYESASQADSWYRVLVDLESGALSCDCPRWIFARRGTRSCKHTESTALLLSGASPREGAQAAGSSHERSLVGAVQGQWPGLQGRWGIEERSAPVGRDRYRFCLIRLDTVMGIVASGVVAFAERHGTQTARLIPGVAGWAGYALAAEVARLSGFPLAGRPPEHFRLPARGAGDGTIGLRDILRIGDQVDLGDGLTPAERAENTLRLFLGEMYDTLERQGYLDVPSVLYAGQQRVYRLRRDPTRRRERRLRVFEQGQYVRDLCVVRAAAVPEADHFLTVFLRLMADEGGVLEVVRSHNVFPPYSDGTEQEQAPAV